jgi:hypothetical protein
MNNEKNHQQTKIEKKISPSKSSLKNAHLSNSFHACKKNQGKKYQFETRGARIKMLNKKNKKTAKSQA